MDGTKNEKQKKAKNESTKVFEAKKHRCATALHRSDRLVQVFRPRGERGQKRWDFC